MNFLRENGKSIKNDDNSLRFILIDRNSRKSTNSNNNFKELDTDSDRLQKLRKRMFWSRSNNNNNNTTSISSNTLDSTKPISSTFGTANALTTLSRPFSKLKNKPNLFGVKLEKLNLQTGQLPLPLLVIVLILTFFFFNSNFYNFFKKNLLDKVASEGYHALMIFRKSASAKLKKYYRQKLDSNQTIDYNEMNVHVAALLLKVILSVLLVY